MFVVQKTGYGGRYLLKGTRRNRDLEEAVPVMKDLKNLKLQLALLQTGCLLALEGQNRVTSSELLVRVRKDQGIEALASTVGQVLGGLGIPSSTSKGKTRFTLDPEYMESLVTDLSEEIEGMEARVEQVLTTVGDVQGRLEPLEERFMKVQHQLERERELQNYLKEHRGTVNEYRMLEFQAERLRQEVAALCRLQSQVESMQQQLETRPELEQKKRQLATRVQALEDQRQEIAREEKALAREREQLAGIIDQLKLQRAWVNLASLSREIGLAQEMLAEVKEEIKRHQSWLERLLRRKEERSRE